MCALACALKRNRRTEMRNYPGKLVEQRNRQRNVTNCVAGIEQRRKDFTGKV